MMNLILISTFPLIVYGFLLSRTSTLFTHVLHQSTTDLDGEILRRVDKWACIKNCGACCKLGPLDSRPELPEYLTEQELTLYKSMIGDDDWCINFDKDTKMCKIYETRPTFCTINPVNVQKMFDIEEDEMNDFCAFCCREHISEEYGEDSEVMDNFEDVITYLAEGDNKGFGSNGRKEGDIDDDGGKWVSIDIDPNNPEEDLKDLS